jgi:TRAP-type C4-dicarboxylate transport system substrate-binding protein
MIKRIFLVLLSVGIGVFALMNTHANAQTKDQPILIKGVTAFPRTHVNNDPVPLFIEEVNKRAQGRLKIDWLGGPEVFAAFDQIHAVKAGTVDMIIYYPFAYMKSLMPEAEAKGLSQLPEWDERKSGAFELWIEIFEKRVNAKYLGRFHNNINFHVYSNKRFEKIADFKGVNIRTMPLYIPFMRGLGANPVTLPPTEMYTSMERGVVDGFMWPRWGITGFGMQEVTKFLVEPGVFQIEPATMINLDRWKKIPKDLQDILMETMKEYEQIATKRVFALVEQEDKVREKAGMRTIRLLPEEGEKFIKLAYDTTWEQIIKVAPEYGPKLRKASSKAALSK